MFRNLIQGASIEGIVCACPTHVFENVSFSDKFGEKYVKKNIRMTGIERFRVCNSEQTASDLCYIAAKSLLEKIDWNLEDIGVLVFVTQFPDYQAPATAFVLQHRLGIPTSCVCFDVNLGCSGYVVGLQTVASLLKGSNKKKGLLLCGDTGSKNINLDNKSTALLFGDAGSATAISMDGPSSFDCAQMSKGDSFKAIYNPNSGYRFFGNNPSWSKSVDHQRGYVGVSDAVMKGDEVFEFTMKDVTTLFSNYFEATGTSPASFDFFIFHQAQQFILDNLALFCEIAPEKVLTSLKDFGNTSVASIPLTLCNARAEFDLQEDLNVFMSGFGIGLSYGLVTTTLNPAVLYPIIFSDEYYEEWQ